MELELGLKITKTKDDIDSISEYQFMKDAGPVFHSRETNTMFILTANNLKGYKRSNIDIKISKDGSKISIYGKKPIQEMVMMGWVMQRKVVDVKGFNKIFKIPNGVNLDKIKAHYHEEEWMMNIVMPKLVKGICGLKIEEFKEQYFDKGKSHQEKGEIDHHVSSSVGETSQKGSKDSEFQQMEGSENIIEKMIDGDTNKKLNKETIQREVGKSKLNIKEIREKDVKEKEISNLRVEDSKVKDIGEKEGKERHEALKTLENMEKIHNETNKDINEETIEKEVGDSKSRIEDGNGESAGEKVGKGEYEVTKKSERGQGVGVFISNKFEDTSKEKEFNDQKMDTGSANERHDDVNRDIIGGIIKEEESNLRSEDGKVKGISHNIVDTRQRVFDESMIQQSGESKQKESKEYFGESEKENSMKPFEAMKMLEVEQNVVGHIPSDIDCINQNEFEESRIPQMENTKSTKGKMNGEEYEKLPFEANQDFQKEMIKPKMKTKDGDQECVLEKYGGKKGFDDEMVIIQKEFPKNLPRITSKEREGLNVEKMQETKNVKKEMVNKEVEYFVEKGEVERFKRLHVEAKKGNNTRDTTQEEIGESENGLKEVGQEQFTGIEVSKGFNFAEEEKQHEVIKESLVENESLIVEGSERKEGTKEICQDVENTLNLRMGENGLKENGQENSMGIEGSKGFNFGKEEQNEIINDALVEDESLIMEGGEYMEKTKEIVPDEEDKSKHGLVKLKGEGSTKIHGEPNEPLEKEKVNNGIFDGRKTQKFQEIKQTEDEDVNEVGANIEKSMKKVNRDKYEKVQNEEGKGFHKNITKKKYERLLQEETSKGISKASNAAKKIPKKMLDSPVDTREGSNNTRIEKTKGIKESVKESSMEPFETRKISKLEPFEANDDDRNNSIKPTRETKDEEQDRKKPTKEVFYAKINEELSKKLRKSSHEESEGLNVLKNQETEDVKENVVTRMGKDIEYFKENGEGDKLKMMDVEAKKVSNAKETMQEEIEKSENGIKGGGKQQAAKIEGSRGFKVAKEEEEDEEEFKKRSKSKEQDEESISHKIVDSGQRVFEESLINQNGVSKQKEIGGSMNDSKERLKEVLKESSVEQNAVDHIHSKIDCTNQNEFREPRVPQIEKTKITKGKKNGGMDFEKTPFEVNEDVQKVVLGDAIQKEVIKTNEEFPKNLPKSSFDGSEGLNVQKIQESENVKEKMVDKEIEYFEKGEGERFKRMYVETKKGNTRETMNEEIEKNENEVKESGLQHAKENTAKEMDDVSKNVTGGLKHKVSEIDESKGFNVAKEEEQKEVTKKASVESESLMETVKGKESKEITKAKRVQDEDDKTEFGIVKLKGEGAAEIHAYGRSFHEKEESQDVNEKGEKIEKFGKKVNNKMQNEEDEHYFPDDASERSLATKDAKEGFSMKILDSQIDTREELKDGNIDKVKGLKEKEKDVPFVKEVKFQEEIKERNKAINQDEEDKIQYGIVKFKGEGSTNHTHKFQEKEEIEDVNEKGGKTEEFSKKMDEKIQNDEDKDFKKNTIKEKDECFLQEEISEGRSKASKAANEPFDDKTQKETRNHKLEFIDELIEKENVGIGLVDGRKIQKFQVMNQTQDAKEKGADSEKTMKKMNGNKEVSEKVEQVEANKSLRNDIEEQNFQSVVSIGFKEFGYENVKDRKQKTKVLDTKFESNERYESKYERMNQEFFSPRKPKEVGENRAGNEISIDEFETIEDQLITPMSVPRFQSEVEEKDIENLIEMKEKEEKNEGKGEFHNGEKVGETIQKKTDETEKKIDYREQENAATDDGKVETKEKDRLKECKTAQNVNDEKCEIDGEVAKSGIEKVDKKKWIREKMKTTREKEHPVKFEADEKEEESSDKRLKNDVAEMKIKRNYEQQEYGEEVGETIQEKKDEPEKKIDDKEQENAAGDDGKVETIEKDMFKELKTTQNVNDETNKIHESTETAREKKRSVKFEAGEKEEELSDERLKNGIAEMKTKRDYEQHEYGVEEVNAPKDAAYEGAKPSKLQTKRIKQQSKDEIKRKAESVTEEHEATTEFSPKLSIVETEKFESLQPRKLFDGKEEVLDVQDKNGFQTPKNVEKGKVVKKWEGLKVADSASGSKRVAKKVHETLKREHQRKSEESTSKMKAHELTIAPNMNNEIPKVEDVQKENEEERYINVPEATISKEGIQVTITHSKEKQRVGPKGVVDKLQENQTPSPKEPFHSIKRTTALEVVADETGQVVEQCMDKDEQAKHGNEEQKEGKDETSGGKKDNAKMSKSVEEENVLKKMEEPKVAKSEEEKMPKMKETTPHFDMASGSKRVPEKVNETQRKSEESTSKFEVEPLNVDSEIPKVEELRKEEVNKNNHVLEATISKEDEAQVKATHAKEKVAQQSKVPSSLITQQLEVEEEEKTKKNESKMICQEDEQCINKEQETKLGTQEIEEDKDNEKVYEEDKEGKDETCEGKKDNAKISKKLLVPMVIAGTALLGSIAFIFVRHRRSKNM